MQTKDVNISTLVASFEKLFWGANATPCYGCSSWQYKS
jgi:hypothetical protein